MSSTILVVDDEALPRKNIARVLEEEEYHVYEAENGDEAIKAINDLDFDLVLCAISKSPGRTGVFCAMSAVFRRKPCLS